MAIEPLARNDAIWHTALLFFQEHAMTKEECLACREGELVLLDYSGHSVNRLSLSAPIRLPRAISLMQTTTTLPTMPTPTPL